MKELNVFMAMKAGTRMQRPAKQDTAQITQAAWGGNTGKEKCC